MPKYTQAGTLTSVEVGRAMRASRQRLFESEELGDSVRAWKIWAACMESTASWSKRSDRVHVVTLANMAGLRPDKVSPILRKFNELGIVSWKKEEGKRSPGLLSLPSLAEPMGPDANPDFGSPPKDRPKIGPGGPQQSRCSFVGDPDGRRIKCKELAVAGSHGNDLCPEHYRFLWGEDPE